MRASLLLQDGNGKYPVYYSADSSDSSKTDLDQNHSHFILVDNGTMGQYGTEIELRSRVEGAISKHLKTSSMSTAGQLCRILHAVMRF